MAHAGVNQAGGCGYAEVGDSHPFYFALQITSCYFIVCASCLFNHRAGLCFEARLVIFDSSVCRHQRYSIKYTPPIISNAGARADRRCEIVVGA